MAEKYIEVYGRFKMTVRVKDDGEKQYDEEMLREIIHGLLGGIESNDESIDVWHDYEITEENTY